MIKRQVVVWGLLAVVGWRDQPKAGDVEEGGGRTTITEAADITRKRGLVTWLRPFIRGRML